MSISSLFKTGNLDEIKPKLNANPAPIPVANLFSMKMETCKPTCKPVKVESENVEQKVKEVIVEKIIEVPKEVIVEKIVRDESALLQVQVELEQVKTLNAKYLQVINQINEELMNVKANEGKNSTNLAEITKEKDQLVSKVDELTKALHNVIHQNRLLSRALGLRS